MKKIDWNKFHIIRNTLFFRIVYVLIIGIFIASLTSSAIAIQISKKSINDIYVDYQEQLLWRVSDEMNTLHVDAVEVINTVSNSTAFQTYLIQKEKLSAQEAFQTIYQMDKHMENSLANRQKFLRVVVLGTDGSQYNTFEESFTTAPQILLEEEFIQNTLNNPDIIQYQYLEKGFTESTSKEPVIIITKALQKSVYAKPYGVVCIAVTESDLSLNYDYLTSSTTSFYMMNESGQIFSSNQQVQVGKKSVDLLKISEKFPKIDKMISISEEKNQMVMFQWLPYQNLWLVATVDTDLALSGIYDITSILLVSISIGSLIAIITFWVIRHNMSPLNQLKEKMKSVRSGDLNQHMEEKGVEEVQEIAKTFNYMVDGLNEHVEELLVAEKEKRRLEIHSLQMQINPHYIFNTLSSIKWLVWQGNASKASEVIDAFIGLLRNTISHTEEEKILFWKEIENTKNYVLINNARYGDQIQVSFMVMPETENIQVPKLILQPIIENSFFHAFPSGKRGSINLFARVKEEKLIIEIIDNGVGMNKEKLGNLLQSKGEQFTGIGIGNVRERLILLYGEESSMKIESSLNKGTRIILTIPAQTSKINDENQNNE